MVRDILNGKKTKLILCIVAVGVIAICAICFLTIPKSGDGENDNVGIMGAETETGENENTENMPETTETETVETETFESETISPEEEFRTYFINEGRKEGRSDESILKCYDFLQQIDVCENEKYAIADYYILFIDDNMEDDYLVMLEPNDFNTDYMATDYDDAGRFLIFMNGELAYTYSDPYFTCRYFFRLDLRADFDNDGYDELVIEAENGGNGENDFLVLKYKDGTFEKMPIFTYDEEDILPDMDVAIYAGENDDEHVIYYPDFDEEEIITGKRAGVGDIGRTYEPGEILGSPRGYHSPDVIEYEGRNALLIKRTLTGEGGNVHWIGDACFVLMWDEQGGCRAVDWWVESE